jgi:23S rRNA (uracil1939-C5)-methyltransferase
MTRVELLIEALARGGDGVAHHEGRTIFVERTGPGDRVRVELPPGRDPVQLPAKDVELLAPGPARAELFCPVADRCGGCRWMHVTPDAQAEAKERLFYEALARVGHTPRESIDARPLVRAPAVRGYRRRTRLHVRRERLGYLREKTHELIEVTGCPVLEPELHAAVGKLGPALAEHGLLARVKEIDLVSDGMRWSLALHVDRLTDAVRERTEALVRALGARGAVLLAEGKGPVLIQKPVLGTLRPDVFAQVNGASNAALVEAASTQLAATPGTRVLELFAGSGNFTLPLLQRGAQVVAVDFAGPALGLLRKAADAGGQGTQLRIVEGDALEKAKLLAADGARFDAVLLDPPRAGCSGLGSVAVTLGVKRIIYVSCDPGTLARDLAELRGAGFLPTFAQPFDLFPMTPHIEGLVALQRQ